MDWQADKETQIQRFILLRRCDRTYSIWALKDYLSNPDCPHPDIAADLKARWEAMTPEQQAAPWAKTSGRASSTSNAE